MGRGSGALKGLNSARKKASDRKEQGGSLARASDTEPLKRKCPKRTPPTVPLVGTIQDTGTISEQGSTI